MRNYFAISILSAYILFFCSATFAQAAAEKQAWAALKTGGILLLRHANAPGGGDPTGFNLADCATQRNLDPAGQRQAANIGARFTAEKIIPTAVLTSQWCRCKETADLAFPGMRKDAVAFNSFFQNPEREPVQTKAAQALLLDWTTRNKTSGTLVVITHQVNINAMTNFVPAPGEGVVLSANKNGKTLDVVGTIVV